MAPDDYPEKYLSNDNSLLRPGDFISDHLRVLSFIGSGGMSHVYLCEDLRLSRAVAVKTLKSGFSNESLRRFQTEGRAIARLEHPNVVKLHSLTVGANDVPVLVMEYVDGISLAALLDKETRFSIERSLKIAGQIVEGLKVAHKEGIIHRDLKPANIMVVNANTTDETVKILDFGIAKIQDDLSIKATQTGELIGTPQYMSPEQALGKKCDSSTDQYSLGCVLYQMLCGRPPFEQESLVSIAIAHAKEQAPPLKKFLEERINPQLQILVSRLLAKNPLERYESMYDVGLAIEQISSGANQSARSGLIAVSLIAIIAILVGVGLIVNHRTVPRSEAISEQTKVLPEVQIAANHPQTELTDADKEVLSHADSCFKDFSLDLKDSDITNAGFAALVHNRKLFKVSLRSCGQLTSVCLKSLLPQQLVTLDLASTKVDDSAGKYIEKMTSLKEINLSDTAVSSNIFHAFASLPFLEALELNNDNIDGGALTELSAVKALLILDISSTNIGGFLKNLKNSSVRQINIARNQLTDSDFEEGLLLMKNLRTVRMAHTNVNGKQLKMLSRLKYLDFVDVGDCGKLSRDDILAFHKTRPFCGINQTVGLGKDELNPSIPLSSVGGPNLIKNGDFEDGNVPVTVEHCEPNSKHIADWMIWNGRVDWFNRSTYNPASGEHSIQLDAQNYTRIFQHIPTVPGQDYCVRFQSAAGPLPTETDVVTRQRVVLVAGTQRIQYDMNAPLHQNSNLEWCEHSWVFKAERPDTQIQFCSGIACNSGPFIDAVSVKKMSGK